VITPNNEQIHYTLAQRYAQTGDADLAIQSLAEAVRRQPRLKKQAAEETAFEKLRALPEFRRIIEQ
jgi:cytochrome c-type biogenesis protein CcmH/NrfG